MIFVILDWSRELGRGIRWRCQQPCGDSWFGKGASTEQTCGKRQRWDQVTKGRMDEETCGWLSVFRYNLFWKLESLPAFQDHKLAPIPPQVLLDLFWVILCYFISNFPSSFQIIPISLHSLFHLHWVWITCSFSDTHCSFPLSCFLLSSFSLEWPCLICLTSARLFIYLSRNNSNATSSYFQLLETFPFSLMFS